MTYVTQHKSRTHQIHLFQEAVLRNIAHGFRPETPIDERRSLPWTGPERFGQDILNVHRQFPSAPLRPPAPPTSSFSALDSYRHTVQYPPSSEPGALSANQIPLTDFMNSMSPLVSSSSTSSELVSNASFKLPVASNSTSRQQDAQEVPPALALGSSRVQPKQETTELAASQDAKTDDRASSSTTGQLLNHAPGAIVDDVEEDNNSATESTSSNLGENKRQSVNLSDLNYIIRSL